jgi:hypothetical protein
MGFHVESGVAVTSTVEEVTGLAKAHFDRGRLADGMDGLYAALASRRATFPADVWRKYCAAVRQDRKLMTTILQSPVTQRALEKPRGYAGDAVLIDYLYGSLSPSADPRTSASGREIAAWECDTPGARSVRARRLIIAQALDSLVTEKEKPNVLAVGCGHLREAELSSAVQRCALNRFIGIDQDGESLLEVERCYTKYGVTPFRATIQNLISGRHGLSEFDLINASGLYDYLPDRTAKVLTSVLFRMLATGGRLLIGNFTPEMSDIGYMEAVMDWRLLYRGEPHALEWAAGIAPERIGALRTFRDPHNNIVFLDIVRA